MDAALGIQIVSLAGLGQILLGVSSLIIPRILDYRRELFKLPALLRQMFITYSLYILGTNFFMGIVSIVLPEQLLDGSGLALAFSIYAALYWMSRLFIQFFYFDRAGLPSGKFFLVAEVALIILFIFLSFTYGMAVWINF
ncbi:hypothetical protein EDD80_102149 [Anseongella ginsenosidimutans]|uniref:Uncharacterized protein n=1 Tax=Anseongella ginsenosidimutans TaxID=496056 RepID=A0A4R3KUY3_9SPHI|nr:hypothetical protein [Anseongella ginsenosidimutans]QEC51625.1 hypothetical protein FRZ59_04180 [Anseongella ginsenosidimutans]TCS88958.1 hypothetical protein EDD80_102149 [Anseongella ginsenosidimutans]